MLVARVLDPPSIAHQDVIEKALVASNNVRDRERVSRQVRKREPRMS